MLKRMRLRKRNELLERIETSLGAPPDLIIRTVIVRRENIMVHCIYLKTMIDEQAVDDFLLKPLMKGSYSEVEEPRIKSRFIQEMPFVTTPINKLVERTVEGLITGYCVMVDVGADRIRLFPFTSPEQRSIDEPESEPLIRGPREGFIESIEVNIGLIRKRLRSQQLRIESYQLGTETRTTVMLVYLDHLAPAPVVKEARERLQKIKTDSIIESAYIEEFVEDRVLSPFPTVTYTEKPDSVTAHLLDGKVAILTDGTPEALVAPVTFFELFISPEDYYQRADIATFIRWIRFVSFFIAVFVPSIYVAVTTFHQELLPAPLLISLASQEEGVPLPVLGEVIVMEIIFEVIREAGLRMPRAIGQALSIVGAIVLGQAAVEADLISAAVVIVVAVTGIANFVVPTYSFGISQRLLRFTFLLLAGFMGLFGVLCGTLFLVVHLVSMRSFGVPYMSPAVPVSFSDWKEVFFRLPRQLLDKYGIPKFMTLIRRK